MGGLEDVCRLYANIASFNTRDLNIYRFWYLQGSWNQSPVDIKGWLKAFRVSERSWYGRRDWRDKGKWGKLIGQDLREVEEERHRFQGAWVGVGGVLDARLCCSQLPFRTASFIFSTAGIPSFFENCLSWKESLQASPALFWGNLHPVMADSSILLTQTILRTIPAPEPLQGWLRPHSHGATAWFLPLPNLDCFPPHTGVVSETNFL